MTDANILVAEDEAVAAPRTQSTRQWLGLAAAQTLGSTEKPRWQDDTAESDGEETFWECGRALKTAEQDSFLEDKLERAEAAPNRQYQVPPIGITSFPKLVTMCAWCRRIRDDFGVWRNLSPHQRNVGEDNHTHGVCPDCREKMLTRYPAPESACHD